MERLYFISTQGVGFVMSDLAYEKLKKNDIVYFVRVMKNMDYYELLELKVVNVYTEHCSATETKSKQTFLFSREHAEELLYVDRKKALHDLKELQKKGKKNIE